MILRTPALVCLANLVQLQALRAEYTFALVTGATQKSAYQILSVTGLMPLFDERLIVTFDDTNSEKGTGKPFLEIKKRIHGGMVMIGDSDSDEGGCAIADIPFVRVHTGGALEEQKQELSRAIMEAVGVLRSS